MPENFWSKGINPAAKKLLLDYLFQYVEKVQFHIGSKNIRSQIAIGKLGAKKISEEEIAYYGEPPKLNYLYQIEKSGLGWAVNSKLILIPVDFQ